MRTPACIEWLGEGWQTGEKKREAVASSCRKSVFSCYRYISILLNVLIHTESESLTEPRHVFFILKSLFLLCLVKRNLNRKLFKSHFICVLNFNQ